MPTRGDWSSSTRICRATHAWSCRRRTTATGASSPPRSFATLLTVLTGIGFGVLPALRMGRGADVSGLMDRSSAGLGARRQRLRGALVVAQVAASVVLLVAAGLLIRALAVVSRSFAQRYWGDAIPLNRTFQFAFRERQVVGVVGDIRVRGLERRSEPQVYLPHRQVPDGGLIFYAPKDLIVHASADPMTLLPSIRRIVREADPELPVSDVRLLADIVAGETAPRRAQITVLAAFATLALLLAGIGIHGLLAFAVSQQTAELALRKALGARSGDILGLVLKHGALLAAIGGVIGLGAAWATGRTIEALLAGIGPSDAATFAVATLLALLTALSGSLVPALRAARVDPTTALRSE